MLCTTHIAHVSLHVTEQMCIYIMKCACCTCNHGSSVLYQSLCQFSNKSVATLTGQHSPLQSSCLPATTTTCLCTCTCILNAYSSKYVIYMYMYTCTYMYMCMYINVPLVEDKTLHSGLPGPTCVYMCAFTTCTCYLF